MLISVNLPTSDRAFSVIVAADAGSGSPVDPSHLRFGVVTADGWGESIESGQLFGGEFDGIGGDVFLQARDGLGARNASPVLGGCGSLRPRRKLDGYRDAVHRVELPPI
jgi:hypothetical protein